LPSASQRAASVIVEPVHEAAEQVVPTGYLRHAPAPSQTPSRPQLAAPSSGHCSRGSVATSAATQAPTLPCAAQVMHVPSHAEPQQTPSTQKPLAHSPAAAQGEPSTSPGRTSGFPTGTSAPGASPVPIGASRLRPASPFSFSPSGRPHAAPTRLSPASKQAKATRARISTTTDDKARKLYHRASPQWYLGSVSTVTWLRGLAMLVSALVSAAVAGCGPSPQRLHCLDYCEQNNNACIAQATTGPALQQCSGWTSSCVAACPP
jgi:hypothetical protein